MFDCIPFLQHLRELAMQITESADGNEASKSSKGIVRDRTSVVQQ
jgi:hypothetical protein